MPRMVIDTTLTTELVLKFWGKVGICTALNGYAENNFLFQEHNGERFVLKVPFTQPDLEEFDFQYQLLEHLFGQGIEAPRVVVTVDSSPYAETIIDGNSVFARLVTWIDGQTLDRYTLRPISLCHSLGKITAQNTEALIDFNHAYASREFRWNTDHGLWIDEYLHLLDGSERTRIEQILEQFKNQKNAIDCLPHSIIHNDINECNVLVWQDNYKLSAKALFDYGDAAYSCSVNNLAICLAYAMQTEEDVLAIAKYIIAGYCEVSNLTEEECRHLYILIGMRLAISLVSAAISKLELPDSAYHQNNVENSWLTIDRLFAIGPVLFEEAIRSFSGIKSHRYRQFERIMETRRRSIKDLFGLTKDQKILNIDLGLCSPLLTHLDNPYYEQDFAIAMTRYQQQNQGRLILGGYGEVRNFYTTRAFAQKSFNVEVFRTKHLGIDVWFPAGADIFALWKSEVCFLEKNDHPRDYGVLVILKHEFDNVSFYTLYGHLSLDTYNELHVGQVIEKGERFGSLGNYHENGGWYPHLHFQLILDLLGKATNFDGVGRPDQWDFMSKICPNPNIVFQETLPEDPTIDTTKLVDKRQRSMGYGLSLSYDEPIHVVRGAGVHLIDEDGQRYLDTVNNVAHVGHENYHVVKAAQGQLEILNTNTRYLSELILQYAERLKKTFPDSLEVLHFTNSGSEANELALRMAKAYSGSNDVLAMEIGYHGNTQSTIDISSYKFDAQGGNGKPVNTYLLELPDVLRGRHSNLKDAGEAYIADALKKIEELNAQGIQIGVFIHESILSCGGQIVLPAGYLKAVYSAVRAQGGIVIADEVQVGFGRVGEKFWAFELQEVIPDIVVMGKPIGNGHPMGAVICSSEIAEAFNNGMEYFNTFGGNPVSAATGLAVLDEIENRQLQRNALTVGNYLKKRLVELQQKFSCIADVRGYGLFLGIEFLDQQKKPLPDLAKHIINAMRDRRILMSSDGPDHNVLKIKPPITFSCEHADILIAHLSEVLILATK